MNRYAGRRVLVAGAGVAGAASARVLLAEGADVTVIDRRESEVLAGLAASGATTIIDQDLGTHEPAGAVRQALAGATDVVISPGFSPTHPVAAAAVAAGLDVYSEPELAWRLRGPDAPPWLAVTGTNGKTTTVTMLASILKAAGHRTAALGNIGEPLVGASADRSRYDALAVELSSFQLHWSRRLAPEFAAILNLADDHLEWHGDSESYASAKTAIWRAAGAGSGIALGNADDGWVTRELSSLPGGGVGWTLGKPDRGQLGLVDGALVDAAFCGDGGPVELVTASVVRPAGAHNVSNALAAAALARAYGVSVDAVREGLTGYQPEPHRNAFVASVAGVTYVDDSKATNPHAALASLLAYPRLIWVAGGQLKGVAVDDLVARISDRLAGAVLLGCDRARIAEALAQHAPGVPVVDVPATDGSAMSTAVTAAVAMARPGDTVLLAPAAASLDMFPSYAKRGQAFASAVRELTMGGNRA